MDHPWNRIDAESLTEEVAFLLYQSGRAARGVPGFAGMSSRCHMMGSVCLGSTPILAIPRPGERDKSSLRSGVRSVGAPKTVVLGN